MALLNMLRRLPSIPGYEIVDEIQEGGMSWVYKGRHRATGEVVAVKIIKEKVAQNETLLRRFEQEFRATTKLLHPNIVRSLDFGQVGALVYLVMEYVDGKSLFDLVEQAGALPEEKAVSVMTQVAQALHYAHAHDIIHRDVKPENILLKQNGQPKLTDFGLVKDLVGGLKLTGPLSVIGTPHFMAPEQYRDAATVSARSDVYALGATLYCAVTGRLPFEGESALETLRKQADNELIPPRALVPSLSEHLEQAILAAMNPDPEQRPHSVLAFVKSLTPKGSRLLPILAAGPSPAVARLSQPWHERRTEARHPCIMATACALRSSLHGETEGEDAWPATVLDISKGGIALLLSRRLEPGTALAVELQGSAPGSFHVAEATVKHVKPRESGHWLAGCAFCKPLSDDRLQALL